MTTEIGFIPLVRRWWWLLLLGTVSAALVANVVARLQHPTYASSATLLVGPLNADYGTAQAAGDLGRTYAELAKTLPVLQAAVAHTGAPVTPTELAKQITATSNDVTRLVTLQVEASSPSRAALLANGVGAQLIALSRAVKPGETGTIQTFMGQREITRLSPSVQDAIRAAALRVFGSGITGRLQMMAPAVPPTSAAAPKIPLLTALGALAGLALSAVLALILSLGEGHRRADAESVDGIPFFGTLEQPSDGGLVVEQGSPSAVADYRLLGAKLALLDGRDAVRSLVVLGVDGRRPGGSVAVNLSHALADGSARVLLVDAGCGTVTKLLGLENRRGYGELVRSGGIHPGAVVDELPIVGSPRLRVLPLGDDPKSSVLESERALRLLDALEQRADIVVISVPPIERSPVGLVWARVADGTLLVGGGDGDSRRRIEQAAASLKLVGARVLGTVLALDARARRPWPRSARAKSEEAA